MKIDEIIKSIDINNFNHESYKEIKKLKSNLSNTEKKELIKLLARAKKETKENVLKAIVCYSIWDPEEAIENARRKGVFRYKVFGVKGRNHARFYLSFLVDHSSIFGFSESTAAYLNQKNSCGWLEEFYIKKEKKINQMIDEHHKKRVRKRLHNVNLESSLFKELLAYIDMAFFLGRQIYNRMDFHHLENFSQEEIAEGVSYLLFLYLEKYGVYENKNYFVDVNFVCSEEIEELILLACQINFMLETELLIDFYNYDIIVEGKQIIIRSRDESFEQSIQLAYIKQQMQEKLFYSRGSSDCAGDLVYLSQVSNLILNELETEIVKKYDDGVLSRYVFSIPTILIDKVAEQKIEGKIQIYKEEELEIEHISREICMTVNELYEKKVTEHCNLYDILLCQRFFRFIFFMQKKIYEKEQNKHTILQSLIPLTERKNIIQYFIMFLKDPQKAKEIFELLEYDSKYKFDIQYTPFISIGEKVVFPMSVVAHSNLMRNAIAYSYLSGNKIVNDDSGLEPLVQVCKRCFEQCEYGYDVYTNQKYKYKDKLGEIDVLIVSDEEIVLIECKGPLMPTSNFEMRATFEHIEKASKQLDLSKEAFEDNGFRKKFMKEKLKIDTKRRNVRTCILLGNRLFSSWSGSKHPIRYIYELDMILNSGELHGTFAKWSIWKGPAYTHEDLVDFLGQDGLFIRMMQDSMDKYYNTMRFSGNKLLYESYKLNMEKLYFFCDENLHLIERDEDEWNKFLEVCNRNGTGRL